jgi:hypothetical protein
MTIELAFILSIALSASALLGADYFRHGETSAIAELIAAWHELSTEAPPGPTA